MTADKDFQGIHLWIGAFRESTFQKGFLLTVLKLGVFLLFFLVNETDLSAVTSWFHPAHDLSKQTPKKRNPQKAGLQINQYMEKMPPGLEVTHPEIIQKTRYHHVSSVSSMWMLHVYRILRIVAQKFRPNLPLCKLNLSSRTTLQKKKVLAWASSLGSSFFSSSSNNPLNLATCGESRHLILIKISKSAPSTHEKWTIQFTFTSVADPTSRPKQIKFGLLSYLLTKEEKRWSRCCQHTHTHTQRTECTQNASHQKTVCP